MASQSAEGFTAFPSMPDEHFRYAISLDDNKMEILLENLSTNEQWKTRSMDIDEFAAEPDNVGNATAEQYLKWFAAVLDSGLTNGIRRELDSIEDDALELLLEFQFQVLGSMQRVSYYFTLRPVELSELDILKAKLHVQQEEIKRLRASIEDKPASCICVQSLERDLENEFIVWNRQESADFAVSDSGLNVLIRRGGVVSITASVRHYPANRPSIELWVGGTCQQRDALRKDGYSCPTLSFLQLTLRVKPNDSIGVKCVMHTAQANGVMTITRVGN